MVRTHSLTHFTSIQLQPHGAKRQPREKTQTQKKANVKKARQLTSQPHPIIILGALSFHTGRVATAVRGSPQAGGEGRQTGD